MSNPPSVSFEITQPSCSGSSNGAIATITTGGNAPYSYAWTSGPTTANRTSLSAGTYNLTVTDAQGCVRQASATLIQPAALNVSVFHSDLTCFAANDGSAVASSIGGTGNVSFSWSNGGSGQFISNAAAGVYIVTGTDANGCTDVESFIIEQPEMMVANIIVTSPETCIGNDGSVVVQVEGGSEEYLIMWGNGAEGNTLDNVSSGVYAVAITDQNGCAISASANVPYDCDISVASTALVESDCGATNVSVSTIISCIAVENASMYQWKFATPTGIIIAEEFTIGNQFYLGQSSAITNNLTMIVSVKAMVNSVWGAYGQACVLQTEQVLGTTAVSEADCGRTLNTWEETITANAVDNAAIYEWSFASANGIIITTTVGNTLTITEQLGLQNNNEYAVTVRAEIGEQGFTEWGAVCSISISINSVGMNEHEHESVIIYPNPSDGESFTMLFNEGSNASGIELINVFNNKGQLIEALTPALQNENKGRIDYRFKNKLSAGIYFIQYQRGGNKYEEKLIVR